MGSLNKITVFSVFSQFSKQYPKQFIYLFVLLLIEGVVAGFSMLAIVPLADFVLDTTLIKASRITLFVIEVFKNCHIAPSFWSFGLLFVLLYFLKGLIEVIIKYATLKIKYIIINGLFNDSLTIFFKAKWGFFSTAQNGILLNTLNKELTTIGDTLGQIAMLIAQSVQLIIFLVVPFLLNHILTLRVIGISFLLGLPFLFLNKISYKLGKRNTETANEAMGVLNELLQAARLILGFGKQEASKKRYLLALNKHIDATMFSQTLTLAIPKFFLPLGMMSVIISIGYAISDNTPISELAAIMWSFLAIIPIIASLLTNNISLNNFIPSYEQLSILRRKANDYEEIAGKNIFYSLKKDIIFNNVNFTYAGREQTITNLNIQIEKGKVTALVGESGSGKSTVTDLLLGLQVPEFGEVLIDGISLNDYNQNSFRSQIGYVPQDPFLFNCSIRENLIWSFEKANDFEIWNALELANASEFIKELPDGINTIVGDRGVRLSGGQRQRIALARALLRKPELLILDEATSALDSESENSIQKSIDRVSKSTTILVVAHRLSTISNADKVYVLKNGVIIEEGSYKYLSNIEDGALNKMLKTQSI